LPVLLHERREGASGRTGVDAGDALGYAAAQLKDLSGLFRTVFCHTPQDRSLGPWVNVTTGQICSCASAPGNAATGLFREL
jgi:hypothetical protein